ncbi:MAG: radical SAM protein [Marinifilaceae bacterium]|nr:radical SAM protein [Marinifilaceae bacterium]
MHYTGTLYRNPYAPQSPLLEITQGCTHNKCKFCTMYKDIPFRMSPMEWIEEDVIEIAQHDPQTKRLQLIGADPFALSFNRLKAICDTIHKYLPEVKIMTMGARVTNIRNKTVEQLKELRKLGITELYIGVESGDEWTLNRIEKGYHASEIVNQVKKLDEAGIDYWLTFLNGVAGRSHSHEHAVNTAKIFNQLRPVVFGTGGLTLFPNTELAKEAKRGEFDPLSEKELLIELKTFLENIDCDARFITHHTISMNLSGNFIENKDQILKSLQHNIDNIDEEKLASIRSNKQNL